MKQRVKIKALQDVDLPVKVLKKNTDDFAELICIQFNDLKRSSQLPFLLGVPISQSTLKMNLEIKKLTTELLPSYL